MAKKDQNGALMYDFLKTDITISCVFDACSNFKAEQLKDHAPKKPGGTVERYTIDFWIDKYQEPFVALYHRFKKFCPNHTEVLQEITGKISKPKKPDEAI